jgi:ribosomal protein S18 acetylase RimI-like enzyme
MIIRAYHNEDWRAVLDIFSRAKPDELKGSVSKEDIVPLREDAGLLQSFHGSHLFVAWEDDQIIGYIGYRQDFISFLFVDTAHYRKGIGTQLLAHVLPLMGNKAWLLVAKTNRPAIALYQKFGFTVAEEFTGKYNGKIPLAVLRLSLSPGREASR